MLEPEYQEPDPAEDQKDHPGTEEQIQERKQKAKYGTQYAKRSIKHSDTSHNGKKIPNRNNQTDNNAENRKGNNQTNNG